MNKLAVNRALRWLGIEVHKAGSLDKVKASISSQLSALAAVSDDHFKTRYPELVFQSFEPSEKPSGPVYKKQCRDRFEDFSGLTAYQSFCLEVACLRRLQAFRGERAEFPFPTLVAVDERSLSITTTHVGTTLKELSKHIEIQNAEGQVNQIIEILGSSNVAHLDSHPSGKNLCVNEAGQLALIDFDLAAIDGVAVGCFQQDKYEVFKREGGYEGIRTQLMDMLQSNRFISLRS